MKKGFIFILLLGCILLATRVQAGSNYRSFEEFRLSEGKQLADLTDEELRNYYANVNKRKFMGWRIYMINESLSANFVSDTVFSYFNNGLTAITYTYSFDEKRVEEVSMSATGSIGISETKTEKTFKNGLSNELKLNATIKSSVSQTKKEDLKIVIEPKTVANLRIIGKGKLYTGVAANYFFWIRVQRGGFEYFIVSTEYPRLEVLPI